MAPQCLLSQLSQAHSPGQLLGGTSSFASQLSPAVADGTGACQGQAVLFSLLTAQIFVTIEGQGRVSG